MNLLEARGLTVAFNGRRVVDAIDLALARGELVGLIGPNGSGKSTTLRALLDLERQAAGEVRLEGRALREVPREERGRRLAYLPQGAEVNWPLSVQRVVALGRLPHRAPWRRLGAADRAAVDAALGEADVAHLAGRVITTLSGGERMLALIARVLAGEPVLILADEPTAALDPYHQLRVMELLARHARRGGAVLAVLHDLTLAARFCDRLVLLDAGRVAAEGPPSVILADEVLARTYHVRAVRGSIEGEHYVVPWRTIDA